MERHLILLSSAQDTVAQVRGVLEPLKYNVTVKSKLASGLKAMRGEELVLLDLPSGVDALKEIKSYCPESTVLYSATNGDMGHALSEGAYTCLEKPLEPAALKAAVRNATDSIKLREELNRLQKSSGPALVLGSGERMQKVLSRIKSVARKKSPVLLKGEKGIGKAIIAEAIHHMSPRRFAPFVQVNFHADNFEEMFFGSPGEMGRALSADGGTIFIRNLGHLGAAAVTRLQQFVDSGLLEQGDGQLVHVDVRVVASAEELSSSAPALACFSRPIVIPALRERKEDIHFLATHFLEEAANFCDKGTRTLSDEAVGVLVAHSWPGNVSELKSAIRRACLLSRGPAIEPGHITHDDGSSYCSVKDFLDAKLSRFVKDMVKLERSGLYESVIGEAEKALIEIVLEETGGNQLRSAHALGITRTTLRNKIKLHGIKSPLSSPTRRGRKKSV